MAATVVAVVIVVLVASYGILLTSTVDVPGVDFVYGTALEPDQCPAHEPASAPGFTSARGATVKVTTTFVGPSDNGSCLFGGAYPEPSGFAITASDLTPMVLNANHNLTARFDVRVPDAAFHGNLSINILVEACGPSGAPPCLI